MLVYIQWARSTAVDWQPVDIRRAQDWRGLPSKPAPTSQSDPVNEQPGWINALNCQGIVFTGYDHYTADGDGINISITAWQDSADFPPSTRWAIRWALQPPGPDQAIGGAVNTRQTLTVWAEPGAGIPAELHAIALPWAQFVIPAANMQRRGKWLPTDLFAAHMQALTVRGWREWAA